MQYLSRFIRNVRGSTAIEFAVIFPLLILFIMGTVELGYVLWAQSSMNYAASYGGRYAFVNPSATSTDIQNFALDKIDLSGSPISITVTQGSSTIDIDGSFSYSFLVLPMSAINLTAHVHQDIPTNM